MKLLVYTGNGLPPERIEAVAREAADGGEIELMVCRTLEQMKNCVHHATKEKRREPIILFHGADGVYPLKPSQVCVFQGQGHRIQAILADGRTLESRTLRVATGHVLLQMVESHTFIQAGRTTFVNADFVETVSSGCIRMKDGSTVSISRSYCQAWLTQMKDSGVRPAKYKSSLK